MRPSFLSFAIIFTALVGFFYAYLGRRLFSFGWPAGRWGWGLLAVPFLLTYLMPFLMFARTRLSAQSQPDLLFWGIYLSMSFISELLTVVVLRDLLWLIVQGGSLAAPNIMGAWSGALESALVSRLLVAAALLLTAIGLFQAHRPPLVKEVDVSVPGLSSSFDGYRIALLSDLHVGPTIKKPFVSKVVSIINGLHPDLVAFPGDVPECSATDAGEDAAPLSDVVAQDGRFYTTGNHEYYWGAQAWVEKMRQLGWTALMNEHRVVRRGDNSLVVAGIPDNTAIQMDPTHAPDAVKALEGAPSGVPILWLAHQPIEVRNLAHLGKGLMLSGHTHGGQFFPWTWMLQFFQPYELGLYQVGDVTLYVTPGTGYWGPPNRLGTRSEITLVILRATQQDGTAKTPR